VRRLSARAPSPARSLVRQGWSALSPPFVSHCLHTPFAIAPFRESHVSLPSTHFLSARLGPGGLPRAICLSRPRSPAFHAPDFPYHVFARHKFENTGGRRSLSTPCTLRLI
jgi:hypothetical protein